MGTKHNKKVSPSGSELHPEEELKEYQAKFKVLFENVCSGVAIYEARNDGKDFVFVDFNPAAEQIEHIKKEELIGKSVAEVFPGVKQFGLFEVFQRVYKTGTPEHHPISVYKDERIAGWRENYVYRLPSGQVVAVYDDVSARKRTISRPHDRPVLSCNRRLYVRLGSLGRPSRPGVVDEPGGTTCHRIQHQRDHGHVGLSSLGGLRTRP